VRVSAAPDRLTIAMYRAAPFLVGTAVVLGVIAWTGPDLSSLPWLLAGFAFIGIYWLGTRRVLRYGPAVDFELLVRSSGWTADRFTIGWRDTKAGRAHLTGVISHAESLGYELEGEPRQRRGLLTGWVDATFVKRSTRSGQ
jgi:hypothetical protein